MPECPKCQQKDPPLTKPMTNDKTCDGSGLTCDGCSGPLGVDFFSCVPCDYDLCHSCAMGGSPLPSHTARANARSESSTEPELAEHERPCAVRRPSKAQQRCAEKSAAEARQGAKDKQAAKKSRTEEATKARMAKVQSARTRPQGQRRKRPREGGEDTCAPRSTRSHRS